VGEDIEQLVDRLEALDMEMNERRLLSHYKIPEEVVQTDLSMKQLLILLSLSIKDNSTMGELSERLAMNLSTLTRAIDKLVDESLAIRQNDPGDRRIVRVSLSSKAKAVMEKIKKQRRELVASFIKGLSPEDRLKFVDMFEGLIRLLSGQKAG
jgi:DNA-binding MarR family transcriptional regulator